jgi:hypothetical protein
MDRLQTSKTLWTRGSGRRGLRHELFGPKRGSIQVSDFSPAQHSSLGESRLAASVVCAFLAALLHLAVIGSVLWGAGREKVPALNPRGTNARLADVTDEIALQLITLDERAGAQTRESAAPSLFSDPKLTPVVATVDAVPIPACLLESPPDPTAAERDGGAGKPMDSQYLGQISARIDRAWVRPRGTIGAARFLCQARVDQDPAGNVVEVTLERCNGTSRWQLSLVSAIESASPLPAPRDPSMFVRTLHMSFEAESPDQATQN